MSISLKRTDKFYDKDFYKWTLLQADLLKKGDYNKADIENIIEEIASLGRSDKRSLKSYLRNLFLYKLKVHYQPEIHSYSWDSSIINSKREINFLIEDSPSLKNVLKEIFDETYAMARKDAAEETKLNIKTFPKECPWTLRELIV